METRMAFEDGNVVNVLRDEKGNIYVEFSNDLLPENEKFTNMFLTFKDCITGEAPSHFELNVSDIVQSEQSAVDAGDLETINDEK